MSNEPMMLGYNQAGMKQGSKILGKLVLWILGIFIGLVILALLIL